MYKLKLYVTPGWTEGGWHIGLLAKCLDDTLTMTETAQDADVIIAHSSGCYSLPSGNKPRLVVLIDPPYWPGKPLWIRILQFVCLEQPAHIRLMGLRFWFKLRVHNLKYGILSPFSHIKVWRSVREMLAISHLQGAKVLVIRNTNDRYCSPAIQKYVAGYKNIGYVQLPGYHEDLWYRPNKYVELIVKEL